MPARRLLLRPLLVAGALAVAACGSSGDDDGPAAPATSTTAPSPTTSPTTEVTTTTVAPGLDDPGDGRPGHPFEEGESEEGESDGGETGGDGSGDGGAATQGPVVVGGSGVVEPLARAVADLLVDERPELDVAVSATGSGDGIFQLCTGEIEVAGSSRPMTGAERGRCATSGVVALELVVAAGPEGSLLLYVDAARAGPGSTVEAFVDLALSDAGQDLAEDVGLSPAPADALDGARRAWAER